MDFKQDLKDFPGVSIDVLVAMWQANGEDLSQAKLIIALAELLNEGYRIYESAGQIFVAPVAEVLSADGLE